MFPMNEDLKKKVFDLVGSRLSKHGDSYDRGSALFTKAAQFINEIFLYDVENSQMSDKEYLKQRIANGLQDPRYKNFVPVLKQMKKP